MNYLQKYQANLNLVADGIIGPNTAKAIMNDLGITDKLLFAHVFSQVEHESGEFTHFRENLNYSAQGLANTWSKYSATGKRGGAPNALAKKLERKPEAIANNVYGDRKDLGNRGESSGDGWKFRGTFGLQLTGRANINKFFEKIGVPIDTDPDTLKDDPKIYFQAGFFWFDDNGVSDDCIDTSVSCITAITRRVNGGENGLPDRIIKAKKVFKALGLA